MSRREHDRLDRTLQTLRSLLDRLPPDLARQAFTHPSWVGDRRSSYERLAFLGDSVLSLAISTDLYPRLERHGAGQLTKIRAQVVSRQGCAAVAVELELHDRLRGASRAAAGEAVDVLVRSDRVLASVCEAVIGACYLAFGFERVAPAVATAFSGEIARALDHPVDYKSRLQETLARRAEVVAYRTEAEGGPPHARSFVAIAEVGGEEIGRGAGTTKKAAEQAAASEALARLERR